MLDQAPDRAPCLLDARPRLPDRGDPTIVAAAPGLRRFGARPFSGDAGVTRRPLSGQDLRA